MEFRKKNSIQRSAAYQFEKHRPSVVLVKKSEEKPVSKQKILKKPVFGVPCINFDEENYFDDPIRELIMHKRYHSRANDPLAYLRETPDDGSPNDSYESPSSRR